MSDEAEPYQETARRDVRRVMPRKERVEADDPERILDGRRRRLERVTLPPMTGRDMHAEFTDTRILSVRSEAAAADKLPGREQQDRPILNAAVPLCLDLAFKTFSDLPLG